MLKNKFIAFIKDDYKVALWFCIIALITSFFRLGGPIVGSIFAVISFFRAKKLATSGNKLFIFIAILDLLPILFLLLILFVLGYSFTNH